MRTLTLIIKQCYFDEIINGTKKQEFREVKPTTVKKYIQLDADGYEVEDENGNAVPIHYDAIRFYVGYKKNRDTALIECLGEHTEVLLDKNGEVITYEHGVDKYGLSLVWVSEQVVYDLGKVLEK